MKSQAKPIANSLIVLREEFDDWAILFDPATGNAFGLNPTGVLIWKHLNGQHTIEDISREVRMACKNVPEDTEKNIKDFLEDLCTNSLAISLL